MKITTTTLTSIFFAGMLSANASLASIPSGIEPILVDICETIKNGNKVQLMNKLKEYRLTKSTVNKKLVCNGMSPAMFAQNHDNAKTYALLNNNKNQNLAIKFAKN